MDKNTGASNSLLPRRYPSEHGYTYWNFYQRRPQYTGGRKRQVRPGSRPSGLNCTLKRMVEVDEVFYKVEYEDLPTICFSCGQYGHMRDACPMFPAPNGAETAPVTSEDNKGIEQEITTGMDTSSKSGPIGTNSIESQRPAGIRDWMQAQKRVWRGRPSRSSNSMATDKG